MNKTVYKEPKTMYEICSWNRMLINTLVVHAESDKSLWTEQSNWLDPNDVTVRVMRKRGAIFGNLTAAQEQITVACLNNIKNIEGNLALAKNRLADWRSLLASNPNAGLKSEASQ